MDLLAIYYILFNVNFLSTISCLLESCHLISRRKFRIFIWLNYRIVFQFNCTSPHFFFFTYPTKRTMNKANQFIYKRNWENYLNNRMVNKYEDHLRCAIFMCLGVILNMRNVGAHRFWILIQILDMRPIVLKGDDDPIVLKVDDPNLFYRAIDEITRLTSF